MNDAAAMSPESLSPEQAQEIRDRLDAVAGQAAEAAQRSGRTAEDVRIMLATKTQPVEKIRVAIEHGFTLIGENRVQELTGKADGLADLEHEAHLIGPLQRNKVNHTLRVDSCTCIESVDNLPLAEKLHNRLEVLDRSIDILVQVNTSREDSKFGAAPEAAAELIESLASFDRLRIRGLMTIGLPGEIDEVIRPSYADLRQLRDRLIGDGILPEDATELSMGMSADFALAIEEGATIVRIGSSVFGARPPASSPT
ncbi:YggS family pyridoxal phosphate-dependent enzyme [Brevibacterium luteolum]|uniref:Pyridoxal phosphate homeostasis protein n=1 Tax=Brevibacterium luteolum TaxID=199591 RepID=A0A6G8KY33_9MICO|nr:YggS family pyridoxal phosphate-dependent enzyme [Brevibacterium luteolum]MBU8579449.1 YggS family pyridoxal phosphate-dependent enzyme [Brevibacterium luteolum]QIN29556.1 YggS family pyridoxal phosphate-dependent enzyme [Brevibacterium luteolum]